MAKFKSLNIGDTVRIVSLTDTEDRCGIDSPMLESIGGVFKITGLGRQYGTDLGRVQLSDGWWYSPKGLEVVEVVEPPVTVVTGDEHGEFVTTETPVGTRVRYISRVERDFEDFEIGTEFILGRHDGDDYPRVDYTDKADYEYISYSHLRVVTTAQSGDEQGVFVTADTPVGTTVVYIGGDEGTFTPEGVPLELVRHDDDSRPRINIVGSSDPSDFYYPDYKYLRVHSGGSIPTTTTTPTEPTPEPVVHTTEDFKYTRVRAKDTGAEGVVVGCSVGGSTEGNVAVLHDETTDNYHDGIRFKKDFVGVPNRIWYYLPTELDIIGGVQ